MLFPVRTEQGGVESTQWQHVRFQYEVFICCTALYLKILLHFCPLKLCFEAKRRFFNKTLAILHLYLGRLYWSRVRFVVVFC